MNIETRARKMANVLGEGVVHGTFKKFVQIEIEKCLMRIDGLKKEFAPYEKRFGMSTQEAWNKYQNGKLGDDGNVMEWMMLFENYRALQEQYDRLTGIDSK